MRNWLVLIGLIVTVLAGCRLEANPGAPASSSVPTWPVQLLTHTVRETTNSDSPAVESLISNPVDGVDLVEIPTGEFLMGTEPETGLAICEQSRAGCTREDFKDESPPHLVYLASYWIYQTEVTNAQYRLCEEAGWCNPPDFPEFYVDPRFDDHPVVYVNWVAAERYCHWAGGRLPTEAEWEKAARGIDGRFFPWGNNAVCGFANQKGCTQGLTMTVGSFPEGTSSYGVLDMAGNVTEWVADWYDPAYYSISSQINPLGPEEGELKVARGGSWKNPFAGIRTTNRTANFPEVAGSGTGFRCVLEKNLATDP